MQILGKGKGDVELLFLISILSVNDFLDEKSPAKFGEVKLFIFCTKQERLQLRMDIRVYLDDSTIDQAASRNW